MNEPGVRQRVVIDANADVVFSELIEPAAVAEWVDGLLVDAEVGRTYTLITRHGNLVTARVIELLRARRLVVSWVQPDDPRLPHGSTVRIDLTPLGPQTVVELSHTANQSDEDGATNMTDENNCEWCGRPGQEIVMTSHNQDRTIDFGLPVLCNVCAALLGFRQPRGYGSAPPWQGLLDADPQPAGAGPTPGSPEHMEVLEDMDRQFIAAARTRVFELLTSNYARKNRPAPPWEATG